MSEDDGNPPAAAVEDDAPARTMTRHGVSGSENRRASAHVAFRLDADHAQLLDTYARDHGMSRGPFVREIVAAYLDAPEMIPQRQDDPPELLQELREVSAQLGRFGNNINQIAYRLNAHREAPSADEIRVLDDIRKEITKLRVLAAKRLNKT